MLEKVKLKEARYSIVRFIKKLVPYCGKGVNKSIEQKYTHINKVNCFYIQNYKGERLAFQQTVLDQLDIHTQNKTTSL